MFIFSGGPVVASAQDFAQFHEDLVAGRVHAVRVSTIDAANKALASQDSLSPQFPEVPNEQVMACCMNSVKGRRIACVLIDQGGTPVTMTVANARDMKSPILPHRGAKWDGLSSALDQWPEYGHDRSVNGRWICMMGHLPAHLMDLADQLRF